MKKGLDRVLHKIFIVFGVIFILIGLGGVAYVWHYDHRQVSTLEEYATTDFQVSRDGKGHLEGAVFNLWDYRYDKSKLLPQATLYVDDEVFELPAATKQTAMQFNYENKLFVNIPKESLKNLQSAKEVRFKFAYEDGHEIDLPLSQNELMNWQKKLRW
ncbi:MAG: hypothetical protein IJS29_00375 [Selenomonadaceae bacterium]|nr:hypothetical protein [Selenomonadaceae bacterium]